MGDRASQKFPTKGYSGRKLNWIASIRTIEIDPCTIDLSFCPDVATATSAPCRPLQEQLFVVHLTREEKMETIAAIDDVVKDLDKSDNLPKIKKLLLCAAQNKWENDSQKIEDIDLAVLLQDLSNSAPSFGHLCAVLIQVIKKLNKKVQYFLIASTIVQKLSKLYPDNQATRRRIRSQLRQLKKGVKYPYDLDDLKYSLSRNATIRRAKVIVFSALNNKFGYSTQDWATLDSLDFDELVRALFYSCETPEDLEFKLYGTAVCLEEPDKQLKAARIIVDSMLPYYQYLQKGRDITKDVDEDETTAINLGASEPRLSATLLDLPSPADDEDEDSYDLATGNFPETPLFHDEAEAKISLAIKKHVEIEESVKGLVEQRVNEVMALVENSVKDLETYLEQSLDEANDPESWPLKYQTLRSFVQNVRAKTSKYLDILQKLEENERMG